MPTEIEIQVRIQNVQPLLDLLQREGKFSYQKRQVDDYFTPPDRDFTAVRPIKEWLRLRDAEGTASINFKNWHYDAGGRSHYCDEYETNLQDIEQARNIFNALQLKKIVTVDKVRQAWAYRDWEIAIDAIQNLGDFVEIEYKGHGSPDPKAECELMVQFLKDAGCGKIERNYLGYPFQLMFPDEVTWEVV
ncbi:MAG: class IV adenylate cyclase [Parcubacteria group bacterium]